MKMKLLFFFVTAAVYPLLVGAVALIVRLINFSAGTDPAGAGMARGFTFIYSSIFVCIVWFILSIVLAQVYFRAWWIGLLAPVTVAIILQAIFFGQNYIRDHVPHSYTEYDADGNVCETGKKLRFRRHGKITEYRSDGTVWSVETYRHGEPDGPCEFFYPDGKMMAKGREKGHDRKLTGIPDGTWSYYRQDGRLDDRRIYEKGELLSSEKYLYYCDSAGLICTIADRRPFTGRLEKTGIVRKAFFPNLFTTQVKEGVCDGGYCEYYTIDGRLTVANLHRRKARRRRENISPQRTAEKRGFLCRRRDPRPIYDLPCRFDGVPAAWKYRILLRLSRRRTLWYGPLVR